MQPSLLCINPIPHPVPHRRYCSLLPRVPLLHLLCHRLRPRCHPHLEHRSSRPFLLYPRPFQFQHPRCPTDLLRLGHCQGALNWFLSVSNTKKFVPASTSSPPVAVLTSTPAEVPSPVSGSVGICTSGNSLVSFGGTRGVSSVRSDEGEDNVPAPVTSTIGIFCTTAGGAGLTLLLTKDKQLPMENN
jgi:hypothetical protein